MALELVLLCFPSFLELCHHHTIKPSLDDGRYMGWWLDDGVQDFLPQNMALWHIEYFKLREFEKNSRSKKVTLIFSLPSPVKQFIKPSCERCPPYIQRKGASLSLKTMGCWEASEQTGLTKFPSVLNSFFIFYLKKIIYLFLAVLGLCCCVRAFSSCSKPGILFVAVHGLLIVVASLVVEHGL